MTAAAITRGAKCGGPAPDDHGEARHFVGRDKVVHADNCQKCPEGWVSCTAMIVAWAELTGRQIVTIWHTIRARLGSSGSLAISGCQRTNDELVFTEMNAEAWQDSVRNTGFFHSCLSRCAYLGSRIVRPRVAEVVTQRIANPCVFRFDLRTWHLQYVTSPSYWQGSGAFQERCVRANLGDRP